MALIYPPAVPRGGQPARSCPGGNDQAGGFAGSDPGTTRQGRTCGAMGLGQVRAESARGRESLAVNRGNAKLCLTAFSAWPAAIRSLAPRLRRGPGPPRRPPGSRRSRAGRRSRSCDAWREYKLTTRLPDTYPAVPRGNGLKEHPLVGFISSVRTLLILPGLGIEVSRYRKRFLRSRGTEIVFPGRGDQLPQVFRLAKLSL
jgi:hypothetical protein